MEGVPGVPPWLASALSWGSPHVREQDVLVVCCSSFTKPFEGSP